MTNAGAQFILPHKTYNNFVETGPPTKSSICLGENLLGDLLCHWKEHGNEAIPGEASGLAQPRLAGAGNDGTNG